VWEAEHTAQVPDTRMHQTGGGGRHYVQHADGVVNPPAGARRCQWRDGYAIWPPSRGYTVINEAVVAPMAAWLLNFAPEPRRGGAIVPGGAVDLRSADSG
jgi:hypothetical protein